MAGAEAATCACEGASIKSTYLCGGGQAATRAHEARRIERLVTCPFAVLQRVRGSYDLLG